MTPDRRTSNGDRDRITELAEHLDQRYRVVAVLLTAMACVLLGAVVIGFAASRNGQEELARQQAQIKIQQARADAERKRLDKAQNDIREARRVTLGVVCAATGALTEAGRAIITGSSTSNPGSLEFRRNLERLGYPPLAKRQAAARKAADTYAHLIASRISEATHVKGVVNKDGTLNCKRLVEFGNP